MTRPTPSGPPRRVVVVGAGLSGLVAGCELHDAGVEVTLVDKGRSVGGRLATRRIGTARLDHGAQFFTVRTPAFQRRVDDWIERDVVRVWSHGFADGLAEGSADPSDGAVGDGYPRYVATAGMNSLAKDLADGLAIETLTMVFAVRLADESADHRWDVVIDDGTVRPADAVIFTSPLPQTFSMLVDMIWSEDETADSVAEHGVELAEGLFRTEYDRTLGLLCTLDRPSAIPAPGGVQRPEGIFGFIGDNAAKGISDTPAVTFHATAEWSEARWDDDADEVLGDLVDAAQPWLGDAEIVESQLKKWRFATPRSIWPEPCFVTAHGTMVLAGDAFAGPRVEGAHNSGLAAAHALLG